MEQDRIKRVDDRNKYNKPYCYIEWIFYYCKRQFPENKTIILSADNYQTLVSDHEHVIKILTYVFKVFKPDKESDEYQQTRRLYEINKYTLVDINQLMLEVGVENYTEEIQNRLHDGAKVFCKIPFCYVVRNFLPEEKRLILEPLGEDTKDSFNFRIGNTPEKISATNAKNDIGYTLKYLQTIYTDPNKSTIKFTESDKPVSEKMSASAEDGAVRDFLFARNAETFSIKVVCKAFGLEYKQEKDKQEKLVCFKLGKAARCLQAKHLMLRGGLQKGFAKAVDAEASVGQEYMDDLVAEIMCEVPLSLINVVSVYMDFVSNSMSWVNEVQQYYFRDMQARYCSNQNEVRTLIVRNYNEQLKKWFKIAIDSDCREFKLSSVEKLFIAAIRLLKRKRIAFEISLGENIRNVIQIYKPMTNEAYDHAYDNFRDKKLAKKDAKAEVISNWDKYAPFIAFENDALDNVKLGQLRKLSVARQFDRAVKLRWVMFGEKIDDNFELPLMEWLMYLRLFSMFKQAKFSLENTKNHRTEIKSIIKLLDGKYEELGDLPQHIALWRNIIRLSFVYMRPGMEGTVLLELETRRRITNFKEHSCFYWNWSSLILLYKAGFESKVELDNVISKRDVKSIKMRGRAVTQELF